MMPRPSVFSLLLALLVTGVLFALQGCLERDFPTGTAAVVDGQNISYEELEAARAGLFSVRDPVASQYGDAVLHEQYRYVLRNLIEEIVICRFMEKKGQDLAPGQLEAEEERIRSDYPEGAFEEMLVEEHIILEHWRQALRRRLLTEKFLDQVLRPEISISSEEVQDYYVKHSREFLIPEQWHFLHVASANKAVLETALKRLNQGEEAAEVQKDALVTIHDVHMAAELLPEDIHKALAPLLPVSATKILQDGNAFSAQVLLAKIPSSMLDPAEISRRVESVLAEEKIRTVHAAWLKKHVPKVKIRIAPALVAEYTDAASLKPDH